MEYIADEYQIQHLYANLPNRVNRFEIKIGIQADITNVKAKFVDEVEVYPVKCFKTVAYLNNSHSF